MVGEAERNPPQRIGVGGLHFIPPTLQLLLSRSPQYVHRVKHHILFHNNRHPPEMGRTAPRLQRV